MGSCLQRMQIDRPSIYVASNRIEAADTRSVRGSMASTMTDVAPLERIYGMSLSSMWVMVRSMDCKTCKNDAKRRMAVI